MEKSPISLEKMPSFVLGGLALLSLYLTSLYSYLLFHSLVETFTLVVAYAIFMLVWNARRLLDNGYLLFIGMANFFVAVFTLFHMLAYKGMGVFPENSANLPTQLWIAGQYLHSLSLLIAPLFLTRQLKLPLALAAYSFATGLLLAAIYLGIFPDCYLDGTGLTPFKKISEYVISLVFLGSIFLLVRHRAAFDPDVWRLLVWSTAIVTAAELIFTFYLSVYDLANLIGHLFRITAFYLSYKAIVATGLIKPYKLLFRDLKQNEETLRQYTAELRTRNEELDAFAHTVAHDLKTPLTILTGFADSLIYYSASLSPEERQESLEIIRQTAFKMNDIIDELLLLAQLRQADIEVSPLDMGSIIAEARQRLGPMIEDCRAEIILPETWPVASGYGPWVEEVWVNYLTNAIKYGSRPPRVELGATPQPDGTIRFWVRDNGPGLTPEQQSRLFSPFTQLKQVRFAGHGLGLSIVRRIVEKLGGQVGVESEGIPGRGSLFFFTLPGVPDPVIPTGSSDRPSINLTQARLQGVQQS